MSDSEQTAVIEQQGVRLKTMSQFSNWGQIRGLLQNMAEGQYNTMQILTIIRRFKYFSLKERSSEKFFDKKQEFEALFEEYDDDIPEIFQKIASFVLNKNDFEYPLFLRQKRLQYTFSKNSILFLICSMALCLFPKQQFNQGSKSERSFAYQCDFGFIFNHSVFKTKAVIEYLKKQLRREDRGEQLTIRRQVIDSRIQDLIQESKDKKMCKIVMAGDNQSIEDYYGEIKVDFANQFIGGGALSHGCVQEQIMFANHPQLFATQLLCESMEGNEAIQLIGFKKYSSNKGYSYSTAYLGPDFHSYSFDKHKRAKEYITAIDALALPKDSAEQFHRSKIKREILKAYCGFKFDEEGLTKIVTGNWGCGAFGGDNRAKLIIQWLSCTLAGKQLIYCPFGSRQQVHNKQLFSRISSLNFGEVYDLLLKAGHLCLKSSLEKKVSQINLYEKMQFLMGASQVKERK